MDTSFLKHTLDKYTNGMAVTWKATAGIFYVVWYRFVIYSVPLQFWWWLGAQPVAPRYFGNWAQRRGLFWYHLLSCRWKGRVFFLYSAEWYHGIFKWSTEWLRHRYALCQAARPRFTYLSRTALFPAQLEGESISMRSTLASMLQSKGELWSPGCRYLPAATD